MSTTSAQGFKEDHENMKCKIYNLLLEDFEMMKIEFKTFQEYHPQMAGNQQLLVIVLEIYDDVWLEVTLHHRIFYCPWLSLLITI